MINNMKTRKSGHKLRVFNIILTKSNIVFYTCVVFIALTAGVLFTRYGLARSAYANSENSQDYIKWMEFNVRLSTLQKALKYDIESYGTKTPLNWVELISYAAAKNWGNLGEEKKINKYIDDLAKQLKNGKTIEELTENNQNMKLYSYYYNTFYSVLNGFVGEYELVEPDPANPGKETTTKQYGLKVFSPIAKGYGYSHYDDFGNSRSYANVKQ